MVIDRKRICGEGSLKIYQIPQYIIDDNFNERKFWQGCGVPSLAFVLLSLSYVFFF